jgi:hypothetical protein
LKVVLPSAAQQFSQAFGEIRMAITERSDIRFTLVRTQLDRGVERFFYQL